MSSDSALILDYHAGMLADDHRLDGFRRAIEAVVREGDVVIDVGTGTGILAALCARAGAAQVYALEMGPIAGLAQELVRANGLEDRVQVIRAHSTAWEPPRRADVLVSETLWNFGFGEGLVEFVRDMRSRALVEAPRLIPSSFDMIVAPVSSAALWRSVEAWTGEVAGYDLRPGRDVAANGVFIRKVDPDATLGSGVPVGHVDLTADEIASDVSGEGRWEVRESSTVHGLAGWFEAQLSPGVQIANAPGAGESWSTVFLPIDPPLEVDAGATVSVRFSSTADGREMRWRVEADGESRQHSTFRGRLLGADWIRLRAPSTRPTPSRLGLAAADALRAFGAGGTIGEVSDLLTAEYADQFHTDGAREEFLQQVVTNFCR